MSLSELLPAIRALPRAEKVQLVHLLADELNPSVLAAATSDADRLRELFPPGATFEIATPPEGYEAAGILLDMMDRTKGQG
jgi:hypothetical protein